MYIKVLFYVGKESCCRRWSNRQDQGWWDTSHCWRCPERFRQSSSCSRGCY